MPRDRIGITRQRKQKAYRASKRSFPYFVDLSTIVRSEKNLGKFNGEETKVMDGRVF